MERLSGKIVMIAFALKAAGHVPNVPVPNRSVAPATHKRAIAILASASTGNGLALRMIVRSMRAVTTPAVLLF